MQPTATAVTDGLTALVQQLVDDAIDEALARQATPAACPPAVDGALRVSKVAEVLDVGDSTVRRLIADGELETVDIAGITHVRASEVNRWLDEQTARARRGRMADQARAARRRRGRASA